MKILLADDDNEVVDLLRYIFHREGYHVLTASDGMRAWQSFQLESPDLLILDTQMPKQSGIDVLRAIRSQSRVPIMMLTVAADEESIVRALEFGADDYLTKPFRLAELRARARALLRRRHYWNAAQSSLKEKRICKEIVLDPNTREVTVNGIPVRLTPTEFSLLHYLMLNANMVVHTSAILESVWGYAGEESDEVVRVTISRLRKKIEDNAVNPHYIVTAPGVGYKFDCSGR
ncbi:MAG TPA: response regulator transcription factor [Anaerolineae bacterium]|nr:response regulator transcription factor [Anaerolineae bacterium]